jgi:hypothetical protein
LAHFGRHGDFPRQLGEQFRLLGILPALAVHDVLELGMSGHAFSSRILPVSIGAESAAL